MQAWQFYWRQVFVGNAVRFEGDGAGLEGNLRGVAGNDPLCAALIHQKLDRLALFMARESRA